MLSADYRQIELRVMAHLSQDAALLRALSSPKTDPFTALAAEVCGVQLGEVTPEQRGRIKQICYGLLYGMGLQALSKRLGCDVSSARDWRDRFLAKYPLVRPDSALLD
jgi:DNA polymerase I-like protein with 3'-5' exonuclease and polymerase domains